MGLFDFLRDKTTSGAQEVNDAEPEIVYGDEYMTAPEFEGLARRIQHLDKRIEWLTFLGGSAGGRLRRPYMGEGTLQCQLRPLKNKEVPGLVFDSQVAAVPPGNLEAIDESSKRMSQAMFVMTGSAVYIYQDNLAPNQPAELWFKTMMPKSQAHFTDEALGELIDSNFLLAERAFRSLAGIHQGTLSIEGAVENFWMTYCEYMDELSPSLQREYLRSRQMRAISV